MLHYVHTWVTYQIYREPKCFCGRKKRSFTVKGNGMIPSSEKISKDQDKELITVQSNMKDAKAMRHKNSRKNKLPM